MKRVGFLYDDIFLEHETPPGHPESKDRLLAITAHLRETGLSKKMVGIEPRKALKSEIRSVHTASYYEKVLNFSGYFDGDTFLSPRSSEAAHFAAGAVLEAVDRCRDGGIDGAFCAVRPPGHHAEADRAMGFCIFNNVAVGARHALDIGYEKIFIVDFDVHHGNGTQHIFEREDSVYYFSTHQYPHYPGTGSERETGREKGEGFTMNIPMPYGAGDREYLTAYEGVLPGVVRGFAPDLMLVSAGYDLHLHDPLSAIRVTNGGIKRIVRSILRCSSGIPHIFCLEGGYNLISLAESVGITIEELLGLDG